MEIKSTKHIFVTGGVVSGLGKGITAASIGMLLKARGLKVAAQKLDPYLNVDPGTMSPYQHGEVFVTDDGAETDLDLGHYERFIGENLNRFSNLTTGKIYSSIIERERKGGYLGSTVQTIPHVTDEIKHFVYKVGSETGANVVITEIGGTIGDIESQPFIEAIRQIGLEIGRENVMYIHVTLVPYLKASHEHKSKPTQHSVKELQGMGISPDVIVLRSDEEIRDRGIFQKIAHFCNVSPEKVIENKTVPILYEAPLMLEKANLSKIICNRLGFETPPPDLSGWRHMLDRMKSSKKSIRIAIAGKYVKMPDAYLSVTEALRHAGFAIGVSVDIQWVDTEALDASNAGEVLGSSSGVLVPGGFGTRGHDGMITAAEYCRTRHVPYFGICLGMQIAVMEYARNVARMTGADSREFNADTPFPVIDFMPDQCAGKDKGGTLRLGKYPCVLSGGSKIRSFYGKEEISERHRHRYEVNNAFRNALAAAGLSMCGTSPDGRLVEAVELPGEDFFIGVQFHPEFKSRPDRPHPLFLAFIRAALSQGSHTRTL